MSNAAKDLIFKILIIIGNGFLVAIFVGVIYCVRNKLDIDETLAPLYFVFCFIFGPVYLLFPFVVNYEETKPEKYLFQSCDFLEFKTRLEEAIYQRNYDKYDQLCSENEECIELYVRPKLFNDIDGICLIRLEQLTNESLSAIDEGINSLLYQYYDSEKLLNAINLMIILCVDRVTPAFQKVMNNNFEQNIRHSKLPVGVSFGGKTIYIAKQEDGFAMVQHKKMRKELLEMLGESGCGLLKNKLQ